MGASSLHTISQEHPEEQSWWDWSHGETGNSQMTHKPLSPWLPVHCGWWPPQGGCPLLIGQTWLYLSCVDWGCLLCAGPCRHLCSPCICSETFVPCNAEGNTLVFFACKKEKQIKWYYRAVSMCTHVQLCFTIQLRGSLTSPTSKWEGVGHKANCLTSPPNDMIIWTETRC